MSHTLVSEISLTNYNIKIYGDNLQPSLIESMTAELDQQPYPKQIIELLETIEQVSQVSIFDKENNLLINSENRSLEHNV
jgi:hypothetical protein